MAEGPVQPAGVGHQLDAAAVGVQQPNGLVEGALQHVTRVADGGDACGDLAERALGLDPPLELLVQARVAQHDGGLAGQRTEQLRIVVAERVLSRRVGGDGAQRPRLADERRAHLGPIPVAADPLVGLGGVLEGGVRQVVAGPRHLAVLDRSPGDALADADRHLVNGGRVGPRVEDLAVVRQLARAGAHLVDDEMLGPEEALRLGHRSAQDRGRVAQRGDGGGDLSERALSLDTVGELTCRDLGLGVQPRVGEDDGGLVGQQPEQLGIIGVERPGDVREDADGADRLVVGQQGCGDHGSNSELLPDAVGVLLVGERLVGQVVVRPGGAALADRPAGDAFLDRRVVLLR